MPATTTDPAELTRNAFDALAAKDLDRLEAMWHPDLEEIFLALGETLDVEGTRAFFAELFTAFEPMTFTPRRVFADGDTAIGEWEIRGTFSGGRWNGFEPTGAELIMRGIDVMEWQDGKLRRNTIYMDGAALARQLGLLPPQDSAMERGLTAVFNGVQKLRARAGRV